MLLTEYSDHWEDSYGNLWSKKSYDRSAAEAAAATLKNCSNCWNCVECWGCHACRDCVRCKGCNYSKKCSDCENCYLCEGLVKQRRWIKSRGDTEEPPASLSLYLRLSDIEHGDMNLPFRPDTVQPAAELVEDAAGLRAYRVAPGPRMRPERQVIVITRDELTAGDWIRWAAMGSNGDCPVLYGKRVVPKAESDAE